MCSYIGMRLPEPGRAVDTTSKVVIIVVDRPADPSDDDAPVDTNGHLRHLCLNHDPRSLRWQRSFPCHSPSGWNWGYGGSGPAELAVMILLDLRLEMIDAWRLHQQFKRMFIAQIDTDTFALHEEQIRAWLDEQPSAIQESE